MSSLRRAHTHLARWRCCDELRGVWWTHAARHARTRGHGVDRGVGDARRGERRHQIDGSMTNSVKHVLAIGTDFDDERVVDCRYKSDQTALGQDLILWDPEGLILDYDRHQTVLSISTSGELISDRARRNSEFAEHLDQGKPMVVFMPPPEEFAFSGESEWRYASDLFPVSVQTAVSRGRAFDIASGEPFASFWEKWGPGFEHRAVISDPPGTPLLRIRGTNRVVATFVQAGNGLVLLLPALVEFAPVDGDEPAFIDDLWKMLGGLRGSAVLPPWTDNYMVLGEDTALNRLESARERARRAERAIEKEEHLLATLRERKLLFAGSGIALENLVKEAFKRLGFSLEPSDPTRSDCILKRKRRYAVVEVKGKDKSAAERDAAQLEKWVSGYYADTGRRAKGILVVNAWRSKPLEQRDEKESFPPQMLKFAAEERGQCLLTGLQLLGIWIAAEANPKTKDRLANSILSCVGPYPDFADWNEIATKAPDAEAAE